MNEIVCPNCGETFELTDKEYIEVVNQVRTKEFQKRTW